MSELLAAAATLLRSDDRTFLGALPWPSQPIAEAVELVRRFGAMVKERYAGAFAPWLGAAMLDPFHVDRP